MRKLSLSRQFRAMDTKQRDFYDELTDEERREFSTFITMKYSANVEGISELQEWYIQASNQRVNQNYFLLSKHPKLQWLLCTTVSPNMGIQNHYWLKKNETKPNNKGRKFLENQFPNLSEEEIELMLAVNSTEQLREQARKLGWDEKRIRDEL